MINKEKAMTLRHGDIVYHMTEKNANGSPQRWRVNGHVKVWKTQPERFSVPIKHGLYSYGYLDDSNCHLFTLDECGVEVK